MILPWRIRRLPCWRRWDRIRWRWIVREIFLELLGVKVLIKFATIEAVLTTADRSFVIKFFISEPFVS